MEKYSDKVMDHFLNPRNVGEIEDADGVGIVGNPTCGDVMKLSIKVEDGLVVDAKFKTFGCGAAIATSSMVTELVKGKTIDEALKISKSTVAEALDGLPPVKMHCSNLASDALKAAIDHYLCQRDGVLSERCAEAKREEPERKKAKVKVKAKATKKTGTTVKAKAGAKAKARRPEKKTKAARATKGTAGSRSGARKTSARSSRAARTRG